MFDFLGSKPELFIKSKPNHKTMIGSIFSLIAVFITVYLCKSSIESMIKRIDPKMSSIYKVSTDGYLIGPYHFPMILGMSYGKINLQSSNLLEVTSFFPNTTNQFFFPSVDKLNRTSGGISFENNPQKMIPCKSSFLHPDTGLTANEVTIKNGFCLPNSYNKFRMMKSLDQGYISASIMITRTSMMNNKDLILTLSYARNILDPSNFTHPFQTVWDVIPLGVSNSSISIYTIRVENQIISTNQNMFLYSIGKSYNSSTITTIQKQMELDATSVNKVITDFPELGSKVDRIPYTILMFDYNSLDVYIDLTYYGINDLLSDIGGTLSIVMSIMQLILSFYNELEFNSYMLNSCFEFHETANSAIDIERAITNFLPAKNRISIDSENRSQQCLIKDLNNSLFVKLNSRKQVTVNIKDMLKLKFICTKQLKPHQKILNLCLITLDHAREFPFLINSLIELKLIKDIIFGANFKRFAQLPSLNISKRGSEQFLEELIVSFDKYKWGKNNPISIIDDTLVQSVYFDKYVRIISTSFT